MKNYDHESAEYWLANRKWTGFLMTIPIGEEKIYYCPKASDVVSIRVTATILGNNPVCDRVFSMSIDLDKRAFRIIAKLKKT